MMKYICIICILVLFIYSCKKQAYHPQIVVDGWIEEDSCPVVYLTSTTQFESVIDSSTYYDVVKADAKITVWIDAVDSEVLFLTRDANHFPPHYYRGLSLKGKVGKTYHLQVILDNDTITSQTTIPPLVKLDTLYFKRDACDTLGYIWIGFNDPVDQTNYYRAFTCNPTNQKHYVATHLSVVDDALFNGKHIEFPLYQGFNSNTNKRVDYRYHANDTILVKFCTMDKASNDFWQNFEHEIINAGNPFGAEGKNLTSNVVGGIGIWCGYGASYYTIITK